MSDETLKKHYTSNELSSHREAPNAMEKGTRKYKEMISKDVKQAETWGNMPFTFSKPKKNVTARRDIYFQCDCGRISAVSKNTCGIECGGCKNYVSVTEDKILPPEKA